MAWGEKTFSVHKMTRSWRKGEGTEKKTQGKQWRPKNNKKMVLSDMSQPQDLIIGKGFVIAVGTARSSCVTPEVV